MKYAFGAAAEDDLRDAHQFYVQQASAAIGDAFAAEVKRVAELISSNPHLGTALNSRFRTYPLRNFPFQVIYQVRIDHIRIIALAHTSKRPGFWQGRR